MRSAERKAKAEEMNREDTKDTKTRARLEALRGKQVTLWTRFLGEDRIEAVVGDVSARAVRLVKGIVFNGEGLAALWIDQVVLPLEYVEFEPQMDEMNTDDGVVATVKEGV